MLIDTDSEHYIIYDARECLVFYNGLSWVEVPSERYMSDKSTKIARCGRYSFYANIDPNDLDNSRYCVVDRGQA